MSAEAPGSERRQLCHVAVSALSGTPLPRDVTVRPLFDSVLQFGVLQPLLVRRAGNGYAVIDGAKRLAAAQAAGLRELPCVVLDVFESDASAIAEVANVSYRSSPESPRSPELNREIPGAVLAELQDARCAVRTCLHLSASAPPGLRRRVAALLMESELQRIGWIVDAMALMAGAGPAPSQAKALSAGGLLRTVTSSFKADCELGGIDAQLVVEPVDLTVTADEASLVAILSVVLGATVALVHVASAALPELLIGARAHDRGVAISVAQNVFGPDRYGSSAGRAEISGPAAPSFAFSTVRRAAGLRSWKVAITRNRDGATFEILVPNE